MDPYEACKVHTEIGSMHTLGVHWGTFMMSDEHYLDPKKDFEAGRVKLGLPAGSIITKCFGETFKIYKAPQESEV
jgi:N-acyl-phosphatidylethanolamine-hydrolysing phospholipase D